MAQPAERMSSVPSTKIPTMIQDGAPEVWLYGVRNPWRFSFDRHADKLAILVVDDSPDAADSLAEVLAAAAELLGERLHQAHDAVLGRHVGRLERARAQAVDARPALARGLVGEEAQKKAQDVRPGQLLLLENLRFHAQEEANDEVFSKQLATLAEYYVNDAFGTAHRAHASTVGMTKFMHKAAAGLLMEKELEYLRHKNGTVRGGVADGDATGASGNISVLGRTGSVTTIGASASDEPSLVTSISM